MSWVERETVTYRLEDLPFDDEGKLTFIDPSIIRLHVPGYRYPVDIGSWCYTVRRKASKNFFSPRISVQEIQPSSFRIQRVDFVRGFIEFLWQLQRMNRASRTINTIVSQFQQFIDVCNKRFVTALDSQECYANAVHQYTEHMIDDTRKGKVHMNSASVRQKTLIRAGRAIYGDQYGDLFKSVRTLRKSNAAINITEKPDHEIARRTYKIYNDVFEQLSDFVLDFEQFPKRIDLEHGFFWFFPTMQSFLSPSNLMSKQALVSNYSCYDYTNGTIRTLDEINNSSRYSRSENAYRSRQNALKLIEEANRDPYHQHRKNAAQLAFNAFIMMFSANTAANLGQIVSFPWTGEYEKEKQIQGFTSIKYRAHNREVTFHIANKFCPVFKKFLLLRSYILESCGITNFEYLFFSVGKRSIRKLDKGMINGFHNKLRDKFGFNHKVTMRMWRAYKSDWLLRKSNIKIASLLLQNSTETVIRHYAEGSEYEAEQELTKFFSEYKNTLLISASLSSTPVAAGQCLQLDPVAIPYAPIKPDCSVQEGCLFCDKYRVHADETDYRKLLSFRYVSEKTKTLAQDEEHYQNLILPAIEKIDQLLSLILDSSALSNDTAESIRKDVYENEKLDNYWQKKLDLLNELGAF